MDGDRVAGARQEEGGGADDILRVCLLRAGVGSLESLTAQ